MDTVDQPPPSPLDNDQSTPQVWVSLDEAAFHLRVSIKTLRRRIQKGQIQAQKVEIPGGFTYRVQLPPQRVDQLLSSPLDSTPRQVGQGDPHPVYGISQSAFEVFRTITDQLQQEKVQLHRENLELAGRLGFYQSEIQHLQARLRAAEEEIRFLKAPAEASSSETNSGPRGSIPEQNSQESAGQTAPTEPTAQPQAEPASASSVISAMNGQETISGGAFRRFWRWLTQRG